MPLKLIPPRRGWSPNWRVRGKYLGISVNRTSGSSKRAVAEEFRRRLEEEIETGQFGRQPPVAPLTFADAALAYVKSGRPTRYIKPLAEHFGTTPAATIGRAEIEAAAFALCPSASAATRNRAVYTPALAILRSAGLRPDVRRPVGAKGRQRTDFLSPADAAAVIAAGEALDADFGTLLRFLLYTGCRLGEALALTWDRVDLDRATAYVAMSKNGKPRSLQLRQDLTERLRQTSDKTGRVFRWHSGGWLREMMLSARMVASGLPAPDRQRPGRHIPWHRLHWVTFHTFCHTWATWMRQYGGLDVQGLVATERWRDPKSAARYAHVVPRAEWAQVEELPEIPENKRA